VFSESRQRNHRNGLVVIQRAGVALHIRVVKAVVPVFRLDLLQRRAYRIQEMRTNAIDDPGVCQSVMRAGCAKTAERIDVQFRDLGNTVLAGGFHIPAARGESSTNCATNKNLENIRSLSWQFDPTFRTKVLTKQVLTQLSLINRPTLVYSCPLVNDCDLPHLPTFSDWTPSTTGIPGFIFGMGRLERLHGLQSGEGRMMINSVV